MRNRVLLIVPFQYQSEITQRYTNRIPLGVLYLGEFLRKFRGDEVEVLDLSIVPIDFEFDKFISGLRPNIVGISIHSTPIAPFSFELSKIIKEILPSCILIAGGVHPSIMPNHVLNNSQFDIVVQGEGEIIFYNLISAIEAGADLQQVSGIAFKSNEEIINTGTGPVVDMNLLPPMPSDLIDLNKYDLSVPYMPKGKTLNLMTSRGCVFKCAYCAYKSVSPSKVRYKSPQILIEELESIIENHGISNFYFMDDDFSLNQKRMQELSYLIHKHGLRVHWRCQTRADSFIRDPENPKRFSEMGCNHISIGIESGDQELLNRINKKISLDTAQKAIAAAKEYGIKVRAYLMVGLPYQTFASIRKTIDFVMKTKPDEISIETFVPFPGSPIFEGLSKWGVRFVDNDISHHFMRQDWFDLSAPRHAVSPVIETNWMTGSEIIDARQQILNAFSTINKEEASFEDESHTVSGAYLKSLLPHLNTDSSNRHQ